MSLVQRDLCLFQKQIAQVIVIESQFTAIEPEQVRAFRAGRFDFGNPLLKKSNCIIDIALQIVEQFFQPIFTVAIRGFPSHHAKRVGRVQRKIFEQVVELSMQTIIGNNRGGGVQPGYVERLARRNQCDRDIRNFRRNCRERDMFVPRQNQIGMNLVGEDQDIFAQAQFAERGQFFFRPHTPDRIMRTAQHYGFGAAIDFAFEVG